MRLKRSYAPRLGGWCCLYLPTYSPWLNPNEMLWRQFRCEVTHCELFATLAALLQAAQDFFDRHNQCPARGTVNFISSDPVPRQRASMWSRILVLCCD
jgi:hypothetical protein